MAMMAKASLLFCPPERDAIGRSASSPITPNDPRYDLYSSSFLPAWVGTQENKMAVNIITFRSDQQANKCLLM